MAKNDHHVVSNPSGGWSVKRDGATRASRHFDNKETAINWGRKISQSCSSDLVVHRRDGTIQSKNNYGNDPCPPRDKDNR